MLTEGSLNLWPTQPLEEGVKLGWKFRRPPLIVGQHDEAKKVDRIRLNFAMVSRRTEKP